MKTTNQTLKENSQDTSSFVGQLRIDSGPIGKQWSETALDTFQMLFLTTAGLDYANIPIEFDDNLQKLFIKHFDKPNQGLAFHYGLAADLKKLVYIISDGVFNPTTGEISFQPFDILIAGSVQKRFILLHAEDNLLQYIPQANFCTLTKRYLIEIKKGTSHDQRRNLDELIDAQMVYHEGLELSKFHTEYKSKSKLYLHLGHGAAFSDKSGEIEHVPIFMFGDQKEIYPLDDFPHPDPSGTEFKYRKKALDAGQLCPPHCAENPQGYCK